MDLLFLLTYNEARPGTQFGPKNKINPHICSHLKNKIKKNSHLTHVHQSGGRLFIRHKCYDPEKPNNHTTVQFLFNDLTIKCIIPLSTITGRQHFKKKVPRDIIISVDIYIHMYIHTPNTHIFVKKHHVFPQSNVTQT